MVDGCFHDFFLSRVMKSTATLAISPAIVSRPRIAATAGPLTLPVVVKL